ncbi:MAG: hypothetical protein IJX99_04750 [Clostridia bacterium]|nr:hypothetical protein [Clostridia bacterium]
MKTNISNLMNIVAEYERNLNELSNQLLGHVYTTITKELDGRENVIEDFKADFSEEYSDYLEYSNKIAKIKKVIYQKNNELKLPNGKTIQDTLVELNLLRKQSDLFTRLLWYKNVNKRITEVNNSYFECKNLNFKPEEIKTELKKVEEQIQEIEFEISKLNSIEFEIEL